MRTLTILLLSLFGLTLSAQKGVLIKSNYKPGKEYTQVVVTTMDGEMDFKGDAEMIERIAASGMTLPIPIKGKTEIAVTVRTGARDVYGKMPATLTYEEMRISMQTMGVDQDVDSPVAGVTVKGYYDEEDRFTVESAPGMGSTFSKEDLNNIINQIQQNVKFPDKPVKVGDTFTQRVPMNIPLPSMGGLQAITESVYTVSAIKAGKVVMDMDISITMDTGITGAGATVASSGRPATSASSDSSSVAASQAVSGPTRSVSTEKGHVSGKGVGTSIYSIKHSTITDFDMELDYQISMAMEGIVLSVKMAGTTKQTTSIR